MPSLSTNGVANQQKTTSFLFFPSRNHSKMARSSDCPQQAFVESRMQLKQQQQRQQRDIKDQNPSRHHSSCVSEATFASTILAVVSHSALSAQRQLFTGGRTWTGFGLQPNRQSQARRLQRGEGRRGAACSVALCSPSIHITVLLTSPPLYAVLFFFYTESRSFH